MTVADSPERPAPGQSPGRRARRPSGEPPPLPRELNRAAIAWLTAFLFWAVLWCWVFLTRRGPIVITEFDLRLMEPIVDNRVSWLTPTMQRINEVGTHWATPVLGWATIVAGLAVRRIRHVLLVFASLLSVTALVAIITNLDIASGPIHRPRPLGMTVIGDWDGFAQPSRPAGLLAAVFVAAGLTLVPAGRGRRWWWGLAFGLSAVFACGQLYTGCRLHAAAVSARGSGGGLPHRLPDRQDGSPRRDGSPGGGDPARPS